jgi:hypothetical protein
MLSVDDIPQVRELTDTERDITGRHRALHVGEACDFCRDQPPAWWWMLEPGAVDLPGRTIITPPRVYACSSCRTVLEGRPLDELTALALVRMIPGDPHVRLAIWAAYVGRRISPVYRVQGGGLGGRVSYRKENA